MMVNAANHTTVNQGLRRSSNVRYVIRLHIAQIFHFIILNIEQLKLFPVKDAVILKIKVHLSTNVCWKNSDIQFLDVSVHTNLRTSCPSLTPHGLLCWTDCCIFNVSTNILNFYENAFVWNGTFYKIVYMYMFWNKEIHMPSVL